MPILFFVYFTTIAQQNDTLKIKRNDKGIITFARFTPRTERTMVNGKTFLKEVLKLEQKEDFRLQKENTDKYGITHQRYQQYYNGIKE
jgi:Zn-dependent metalloprotease